MAYLFIVEDKIVKPTEETLLIEPFSSIWERDNSKGKELALKEFAYIEFSVSLLSSNPYKGYSDKVRHEVLCRDLFNDESWKPDTLVLKGLEKISIFQKEASSNYTLYVASVKAKDKLVEFLESIDLKEKNWKTGAPIYKPKEITSALLDVDKVTASLDGLRKKVEEELFDSIKTKGQKEISPFAKVESLK